MDRQYFVAKAPGAGVIEVLTDREIRRLLTAGSLRPTDVCLSTTVTGELKSQWRPLSEVFGSADDEGDGGPAPPSGGAPRSGEAGSPQDGRPLAVEVGQALLCFGQVVAVLGIFCSVFGLFLAGLPHPLTWAERLLVVVGSVWSGAFSGALFVLFGRVKQAPPV